MIFTAQELENILGKPKAGVIRIVEYSPIPPMADRPSVGDIVSQKIQFYFVVKSSRWCQLQDWEKEKCEELK